MAVQGANIVIIDDDDGIRQSLERSLVKRGYSATSFASAQAFLSERCGDTMDCIVLDYGMPEMDGLALQELLVSENFPAPIIFITGHGGVPESVQAMRAGAIDFLEKPFRTDALVERIEQAVTLKKSRVGQRQKARDAQERLSALTDREMEIASLITSDPTITTSKEIARTLDISPRTVDHHRARILEKLGIKSIVELVDIMLAARDN